MTDTDGHVYISLKFSDIEGASAFGQEETGKKRMCELCSTPTPGGKIKHTFNWSEHEQGALWCGLLKAALHYG